MLGFQFRQNQITFLHVIFFTFDSATPKNTVKNDEIYPIFWARDRYDLKEQLLFHDQCCQMENRLLASLINQKVQVV